MSPTEKLVEPINGLGMPEIAGVFAVDEEVQILVSTDFDSAGRFGNLKVLQLL